MPKDLPSIEDLLKKTTTPTRQPSKAKTLQSVEEKLEQKMTDVHLGEKEGLAQEEATRLRVGYVNLKGFAVTPEALVLIPKEQATALKAVCFLYTGPELRLGAVDPTQDTVKEIGFQLGERYKSHVVLYKITPQSFEYALKLYDMIPHLKQIVKGVKISEDDLTKYRTVANNFEAIQKLLNAASVTDVIAIVIAAALELDSSDIHIEAEEHGIMVRLRVDGVLQNVARLPPESWKRMISRIKLISDLKLNITDRPQDGRFTIFLKNENVDVRTSSIPTAYGESVVMRLLHPGSVKLGFEALGFRPRVLEKFKAETEKPHGMIMTTGPTGSGKTTTLYAVLQRLNTPDVKIITLEDPVEYKLEGINQSQIDHAKDYTFAKGLRSILRQDPDIIMVGEIRDLETAEISIQAALTGHLMLSTIHTNDAAGAIPRFLSMGVKPFLLAPALNAIIGQRLVRKIHSACKEDATLEPDVLERVKKILYDIPANAGETVKLDALKFSRGKGCDACNHTGFKGRLGIYELLVMDAEVEKAVLESSVSEYQMRDIAKAQGMTTMVQDGLLKALDGVTSVDEVFRVAGE